MESTSNNIEQTVAEKYENLTNILIERNITVSTMESCTSGLITSCISDTSGSSAVLKGGFITYCNEAKILNGVPEDVINMYGVYSDKTAEAMASACREKLKSDMGIGITGTFSNPDPANSDSISNEIHFAINYFGKSYVFSANLEPENCRHQYKLAAALLVCNELLKLIESGSN